MVKSKKLIKIIVNDMCDEYIESCDCKHECIRIFNDGSTEKLLLSCASILHTNINTLYFNVPYPKNIKQHDFTYRDSNTKIILAIGRRKSRPELFINKITRTKKREIKIIVNDICENYCESYECKQNCVRIFEDGSTEKALLNCASIMHSRITYINVKNLKFDGLLECIETIRINRPKLNMKTRIKHKLFDMIDYCFS